MEKSCSKLDEYLNTEFFSGLYFRTFGLNKKIHFCEGFSVNTGKYGIDYGKYKPKNKIKVKRSNTEKYGEEAKIKEQYQNGIVSKKIP